MRMGRHGLPLARLISITERHIAVCLHWPCNAITTLRSNSRDCACCFAWCELHATSKLLQEQMHEREIDAVYEV